MQEEGPASSVSSQASDASVDDIFENHIENLFEKRCWKAQRSLCVGVGGGGCIKELRL